MSQSKSSAFQPDGKIYTLRKGGVVCVQSTVPGCGYSTQELKELRTAGFHLYVDEKKHGTKSKGEKDGK